MKKLTYKEKQIKNVVDVLKQYGSFQAYEKIMGRKTGLSHIYDKNPEKYNKMAELN